MTVESKHEKRTPFVKNPLKSRLRHTIHIMRNILWKNHTFHVWTLLFCCPITACNLYFRFVVAMIIQTVAITICCLAITTAYWSAMEPLMKGLELISSVSRTRRMRPTHDIGRKQCMRLKQGSRTTEAGWALQHHTTLYLPWARAMQVRSAWYSTVVNSYKFSFAYQMRVDSHYMLAI